MCSLEFNTVDRMRWSTCAFEPFTFIFMLIHLILGIHLVRTCDLACQWQREEARQSHTAAALAIAQKLMYCTLGDSAAPRNPVSPLGEGKMRVWGSKEEAVGASKEETKVAWSTEKFQAQFWRVSSLVNLSMCVKLRHVRFERGIFLILEGTCDFNGFQCTNQMPRVFTVPFYLCTLTVSYRHEST